MNIDPQNPRYAEAFSRLLQIMNELREGCPWDNRQTLESLRYLTLEETYELSDAIMKGDMDEVKKELGDILLHIVFYSRIASEQDAFDIADVIHALCEKLIRRHPHIYADVKAESEAEVKRNWELLKLQEQEQKGSRQAKGVLSGVPASLPALLKAIRIQEKARGAGFDWDDKSQVWAKVEEEMNEFKQEFNTGHNQAINQDKAEAEFGDLLFSLVNYARFININPETALERTNRKFIGRFQYMEEQCRKHGKNLAEMTLAEMDVYWEEAKKAAVK